MWSNKHQQLLCLYILWLMCMVTQLDILLSFGQSPQTLGAWSLHFYLLCASCVHHRGSPWECGLVLKGNGGHVFLSWGWNWHHWQGIDWQCWRETAFGDFFFFPVHVEHIAKCTKLSRLEQMKMKVVPLVRVEFMFQRVFVVIPTRIIVLTNIRLAMRKLGLSFLSSFISKWIPLKGFCSIDGRFVMLCLRELACDH